MPIQQQVPPEAHETLKKNPEALYLDVRTEAEFAAGHPEGAINIPVLVAKGPGQMQLNLEFVEVAEKVIPRDRKLVVGCMAGGRSQRGARCSRRTATPISRTWSVALAANATRRGKSLSLDGATQDCR